MNESSWTCTGSGRNQICTFTNFCVDKHNGPFVLSSSEPPQVNLINGAEEESMWFQPKHKTSRPRNIQFINETLFVYGLYSPFHFSHFLYNGLMPLFSLMKEHDATPRSWTLRAATFWNEHTPIDFILPGGPDIVLEENDALTGRQVLPSRRAMCFPKAVVGTGNRCSLFYCEGQIRSQHYQEFKDYVLEQPVQPNNTCEASRVIYKETGQYRVGILNRQKSRRITNVPELIERMMALDKVKDGIDYSVVTIDFEKGCDLIHTANVVKDLDILIAPFGNGLGSGLFMKNDATVISIPSRYYTEDWFKYPMTAIGRRLFEFQCDSSHCQEYEEDRAAEILNRYGVVLNATEMTEFVASAYPREVLLNHLPEEKIYTPIGLYHKDVERRIDVDGFLPFLKRVMDNKPPSNMTFPDTCQKENVCCDSDCGGPLSRNIFGENNAWK
ncbi:hypothetical protein INT47_012582 [Mucor saturninus]|uniref:Glycosyltransferase 61 catalytic domain-containing protein n=1 Tax=Mucor saturninus TaxID=64648 RepID=A0A8H7R764_9FUNG|nr:hypothetical protein INT47_012582 [Mucor saturninus]